MDIQSSFHMNETNVSDYNYVNNEFILNLLNDSSNQSDNSIANDSIDDYDPKKTSHIVYDIDEEQQIEKEQLDYHNNKDYSNWYYSKMIVSHSWQDKNNTEFFTDFLEKQLQTNNDCFENIHTVYYKNELDIDIIYSFETGPAKHLIDNLRIPPFKPNGLIFNNPEDSNKWSFKIVIITSKGIYCANRYINENNIGFY